MLSDTLSDAVREIEQYQRDFPETYDAMKDEIEPVKLAMNKLRQKLDAPPSVPC